MYILFNKKKNYIDPYYRQPRSFMIRYDHPLDSNFHIAPGAFGNQFQSENFEYLKQKTYLEWDPPKTILRDKINYIQYDKVVPYDIIKEN